MFGYITVNKDELKIKDYRRYRAFYCGVCHSLGEHYGLSGRMTLTYDMTFMAIVLSALYEDSTVPAMHRCIPHPVRKHEALYNEYTDYAAAVNIMLTYYKLKDDWEDERKIKSNAFAALIKSAFNKAKSLYPRQARAIETYIAEQKECENLKTESPDIAAGPTGRMLAQIFDYRQDEWSENLRRMGFYLGKYIYIMDAFDDLERDIRKDNYNPFAVVSESPSLEDDVRQIEIAYASEAAKAFEALPVLDNADIIRNIIYSGIWSGFNKVCSRRHGTGSEERK